MEGVFEVGKKWSFIASVQKETLSPEIIEQAVSLLERWSGVFPKENSWSQQNFDVPSLIVRLDCVAKGGRLLIYEVEERPAGVGIATQLNLNFAENLGKIRAEWPEFKSLVSPLRKSCDDFFWLKAISMEAAMANGALLLIRAEPEEEDFHPFLSRSVSSLIVKGDKSYGTSLGLWREIAAEDFDFLPWDRGFCLKPVKGSKCRGVEIWLPSLEKKKTRAGGVSTKTRIKKVLEAYGRMYLQNFIEPMRSSVNENLFMAYRIFFGYSPSSESYIFLGGLWNARPNLKIHGATDTVVGPVD